MYLLTQSDPDYPAACLAWNRAVTKKPACIAFCESITDLKLALTKAQASGYPLRIRSGRHHYEGASSGDGAFVIDVSPMQTITIDSENHTVSVAAGVRNWELYETLAAAGYPFPGGGCPTVGVVGFTTGGGWGYSSRYFGLGCDALTHCQLLTFQGELLSVSATSHPDLFWALRGGGAAAFGIVTQLTFTLPTPEPIATRIQLDAHFPTAQAALEICAWYQTWFPKTPRLLNLKLVLYRQSHVAFGIKLTGLAYADAQATTEILAPLLARLASQLVTRELVDGPVIDAYRTIQTNHPDFEAYKSGGRFLATGFSLNEWQQLANWLCEMPESATYVAFTLYGLGGAVTDLDHDATAFAFRTMHFIFGAQIVWDDPQTQTANQNWLIERWPAICDITTGSFLNFPFAEQDEANYYGPHYARFRAIQHQFTTR